MASVLSILAFVATWPAVEGAQTGRKQRTNDRRLEEGERRTQGSD